jgi:hypothetical protein
MVEPSGGASSGAVVDLDGGCDDTARTVGSTGSSVRKVTRWSSRPRAAAILKKAPARTPSLFDRTWG